MSAKEYEIVEDCLGTLFLAKVINSRKRLSQDRRAVTDTECILCAYNYLKRRCAELNDDTIVISDSKGEQLFEMKLLKKEDL